jgi:hypothetical protein
MNWRQGSDTYRQERTLFITNEFNTHFGVDATKLQNWQSLCRELQIEKPIDTITKCRKALAEVYVNIVDLVDCRRTAKTPRKFSSLTALRKYTKSTGKFYSKQEAKDDGFLKALLRNIYRGS